MIISYEGQNIQLQRGLCYSYDYVGFGRYTEQVRAWRDVFPNVRVWIHEEFFSDIPAFMEKLVDFLEIPMHPSLLVRRCVNSSGVHRNRIAKLAATAFMGSSLWKSGLKFLLPRHFRHRIKMGTLSRLIRYDPIPEGLHLQLKQLYASEIDQLELLLGRSLDIWRDSTLMQEAPE